MAFLNNPYLDDPMKRSALQATLMRGTGVPGQDPQMDQPKEPLGPVKIPAQETSTLPTFKPPQAPAPSMMTSDVSRGTTPETPIQVKPIQPTPPMQAREQEYNRLASSPSGISQIKNPWGRIPLKILDAATAGLFPTISMSVPGTELHHRMLVDRQGDYRKMDQDVLNDESNRQHQFAQAENLESEIPLHGAQTRHADAQAEALLHPKPERPYTTETDQGVIQFNPETGRFDIKVGGLPSKQSSAVHTEVGDDGVLYNVTPDGKATAFTVNGQPFKPQPKPSASEETTDIKNYHAAKAEGYKGTFEQWQKDEANRHKPAGPAPPQAMVYVPDGHGGYTSTLVRPGQSVPAGAVTSAGVNSAGTVSNFTKTQRESVPTVIDMTNRIEQLVNQQVKDLGPAASRWNEFMTGKVGAPNKDFAKLRTDTALLATKLMQMHVGSRGGERIMEHFMDLIDSGRQSPENMVAALQEIRNYANEVRGTGSMVENGEGNALPGGITVDQINAEIERRKKGKK